MRRRHAWWIAAGTAGFVLAAAAARAPEPPPAAEASETVRFVPLDIYVDPAGAPLAAYQFELRDREGDGAEITLAGVEGGEPGGVFAAPPAYDPAALHPAPGEPARVIVAAFSTENAENLPRARTRVARLHLQVTGAAFTPDSVTLELRAAGDAESRRIDATIEAVPGEPERTQNGA